MNTSSCPPELQVMQASRSGLWTQDLAAHVAVCADCADLALVSRCMSAAQEPADLSVDLTQARLIWARAEGEKRHWQARRALMPVMVAELAACLVVAFSIIALAIRIASPLAQGLGSTGQRLAGDPVVSLLWPVVAALLVGLALLSLVLAIGFRAVRS